MFDGPLHTSTTTSHDQSDTPSRGLLDQRVFYLDRIGSTRLKDQHATVLIDAVAIAHRLIFSPKSLQILYSSLHRAYDSEMLFRKGLKVGISPHIAPALLTFAVKDGMHVIQDRMTHQDGYVRICEPRGLRVSATVSHVRISCGKSVNELVDRKSDKSRDTVDHDLPHALVSPRYSAGTPYLPQYPLEHRRIWTHRRLDLGSSVLWRVH